MSAQPHAYHIDPESELARRLREAGPRPVIIENEGVRFRVVREPDVIETTEDPWANYDVEKVLRAIEQGAGALMGVDTDALLREISQAREQDTSGRPA